MAKDQEEKGDIFHDHILPISMNEYGFWKRLGSRQQIIQKVLEKIKKDKMIEKLN